MSAAVSKHLRMCDDQYLYCRIPVMNSCYLIINANHRSIALEHLLVCVGCGQLLLKRFDKLACEESSAEGNTFGELCSGLMGRLCTQ